MNFIDFLEGWGRSQLEKDLERKKRGTGSKIKNQAIEDASEIMSMEFPSWAGPLEPLAKVPLASLSGYDVILGGLIDSLQGGLEGLGMSRSSSDLLGRDLAGMANFTEAVTVPYVGLFDKLSDFATMTKKARPYLLGEKLETDPDVNMLGREGKPPAVAIEGERYSSRDIAPIKAAEERYLAEQGIDIPDYLQYPEQDIERAKLIAAAYERMQNNPDDPKVKAAYEAMIEETLAQYNAIKDSGINFTFLRGDMTDPYAETPALGYKDIVENKNLTVFPTDFGYGTDPNFDASANPLLTSVGRIGDKDDAVANDAFRIVHDVFGHMGSGNPQFRNKGEERAWLQHSRMFSPEARGAMTTETRGQNSWVNFGPEANRNLGASGADTIYADQKVGLMPDWTMDPEGMPDGIERKQLEDIIRSWGQ